MRAVGVITRGTTNPNRLRRVDHWIVTHLSRQLAGPDPLVVDLGFGATPVTTAELRSRLAVLNPGVRVVGLEIAPERVAAAQSWAGPGLEFRYGGFELAGLRPVLVRALNVLRQYDEAAGTSTWSLITASLGPGGVLVEGTCDELGRLGSWVCTTGAVPRTLTLAADLRHLARPADLAERLPKSLIHRNVPGEPVHALLRALDDAWLAEAPYAPFGPRQRFGRAVAALRRDGWPVAREPREWRRGQLTLAWSAVS